MNDWLTDNRAHPVNDSVIVRTVEDGICEIAMQDSANRNGMSQIFVTAFIAAMQAVARDTNCKVTLLTGLPDYFCTGATRDTLADLVAGNLPPTELTLGRLLLNLPVPIIAAAEGHAIGGGFALLLAADLTVLAADARYGTNFMSLGITPGMGTTRLLEHSIGPALAHEMLYSGDLWRGARLEKTAGFNAVLPRHRVREHALLLARAIAEKPRDNIVQLKRVLTLPRRLLLEQALTQEALMHQMSLANLDLNQMGGL